MLKQQRLFQAKIAVVEGRSRHNNIRIYGTKEGAEGSSMLTIIDNFLKTDMPLNRNSDLQIQQAH